MSREELDGIAEVAEKLKLSSPDLIYRRLFFSSKFELIERDEQIEEKDNYEEQWRQAVCVITGQG
jgi:hypothetical protein